MELDREQTPDEIVKSQIKAATTDLYPTSEIEQRIAHALKTTGEFQAFVNNEELAAILSNVVYMMFAQQTVAGLDVGIVHNVVEMKTKISDEIKVTFVVHIHKPIIAFLEFRYELFNDIDEDGDYFLAFRGESLKIKEKTRRFDIKAKAALSAMNVPRITRNEMNDLASVIKKTLPPQLRGQGFEGELANVRMYIDDGRLCVKLKGDFWPVTEDEP